MSSEPLRPWKKRKEIFEILKERDGEQCIICGAEEVPLFLHHVVPLSEGGIDDLDNLVLVCQKHHMNIHRELTEYDFVTYLYQMLKSNNNFQNINKEQRLDKKVGLIADITAEEKIDEEWAKIIIECKIFSSFTLPRLTNIINQLKTYQSYIVDAKMIFAFPGELDSKSLVLFKNNNIEVWDIPFISTKFKEQIQKIYHPVLQPLLLLKKPIKTSPEMHFIHELKKINPGKKDCYKYQKLIGTILATLFCPPLSNPISELSDNSKVNRRDFILPNYAENGFWASLRSQYSADFIIVDAKNYGGKIKKVNVLQVSNYLKKHGAGLFGLIISRNGGDTSCLLTVNEIWTLEQKLVIVLTDDDIEKMLLAKASKRNPELIIRQKIEDFRLIL